MTSSYAFPVADEKESTIPRHPIRVVSARTGLPQDVIRAWERRYGAVTPPRGGTGRRLYSDEDIERLRMLRRAVCAGRRISDVACLCHEALGQLVSEDHREAPAGDSLRTARVNGAISPQVLLDEALRALETLDRHRLEHVLGEAQVEMSGPSFRQHLVVPFLDIVGTRWHEGTLRIVHEHLASTIVRSFLSIPRNGHDRSRAPRIVVTTPAGQHHELGALMAGSVAEEIGWDVYYLGPNLPAEEIAAAVRQIGARAVALSLCYRENDAHLFDELRRLRHLIDDPIPVFAGGNAAGAIRERLLEAGLVCPVDLADFRSDLQSALIA